VVQKSTSIFRVFLFLFLLCQVFWVSRACLKKYHAKKVQVFENCEYICKKYSFFCLGGKGVKEGGKKYHAKKVLISVQKSVSLFGNIGKLVYFCGCLTWQEKAKQVLKKRSHLSVFS